MSLGMMEVDATWQAGEGESHLPEDIAMSYCFFLSFIPLTNLPSILCIR